MDLLAIFLNSKELKKTIVSLSEKHQIPLKYICNEAGINYAHFMKAYINSVHNKALEIKTPQIEILFEMLGIEIRYQVVIKTDHDAERIKKHINQKHGQEKGTGAVIEAVNTSLD